MRATCVLLRAGAVLSDPLSTDTLTLMTRVRCLAREAQVPGHWLSRFVCRRAASGFVRRFVRWLREVPLLVCAARMGAA
jgi:hypothetical protein